MKRGFTLIEMSVVLIVLALVTHLGMRELGSLRDQRLADAADRQLEAIRAAVYGADKDGQPSGFLADMGRPVCATNGTLAELWQRPTRARDYAVLPATKEHFTSLPDGMLKNLTNACVRVGTGWRGPYLHLPLGRSRLLDPWGNPVANPDAAGFNRLTLSNDWAVAASHFGPTGLSRGRRSLSLLPEGGATSRLVLQVVSEGGTFSGTVDYAWYGPCDGLITGACERAVAYGTPCVFTGLTPGRRTLWDSASKTARIVNVLPGDNHLQIRIP